MAFIDFYYDFEEDPTARFSGVNWIYNVHAAVGPGADNRRDDVALVQTLLNTAAYTVKGMHVLKVDGLFGKDTRDQIRAFQGYVKSAGSSIATDGRVDRAIGANGSISHTRYTIRWLNGAASLYSPSYFPELGSSEDGRVTVEGKSLTGYAPHSLPPLLHRIFHQGVVA